MPLSKPEQPMGLDQNSVPVIATSAKPSSSRLVIGCGSRGLAVLSSARTRWAGSGKKMMMPGPVPQRERVAKEQYLNRFVSKQHMKDHRNRRCHLNVLNVKLYCSTKQTPNNSHESFIIREKVIEQTSDTERPGRHVQSMVYPTKTIRNTYFKTASLR